MGKNGALIRARKDETVTRTFTRKQLEEHDMQVRRQAIEERQQELKKYIDARADEMMKEYFSGNAEADIFKVMRKSMAIPCKVLIEQFGFTPITSRIDDRMRIVRFAKAVQDEIREMEQNDNLKEYAERVSKKYGIEFRE